MILQCLILKNTDLNCYKQKSYLNSWIQVAFLNYSNCNYLMRPVLLN